jgi:hypothetical protein
MMRRHVVVVALLALVIAACSDDGVAPEEPLTFLIVEGACGNVIFSESIGVDFASALTVIETRKVEQFGEDQVVIDPFLLQVVDEHGNPPEPDFYAIRVLDAETGHHVHSVTEVITTDGDLFILWWCPD